MHQIAFVSRALPRRTARSLEPPPDPLVELRGWTEERERKREERKGENKGRRGEWEWGKQRGRKGTSGQLQLLECGCIPDLGSIKIQS